MNPKDGFDFNEILWSFLIKVEGGAKNYKREHPLPYPGDPLPSFSCSERGMRVDSSEASSSQMCKREHTKP